MQDRGRAVAAMGLGFERFITAQVDVAAVIGIGGGGTSMICTGLRALPLGLPKLMVSTLAEALADCLDPMVFHATGTGGRSMEQLADSGLLVGFADMTTTEIADLLVGGVLPATEDRLGAVQRTRLPWVGSVGALDMVNFWAPETVPARFAGRRSYHHNPSVTLMRTAVEECSRIGAWMAGRLNLCNGEVRLLLPEKAVSALDIQGGAFFDPEAHAALFEAIEARLKPTARRQVMRLPLHINDPAFARVAVDMLCSLIKA